MNKEENMGKKVNSQNIRRLKVDKKAGADSIGTFKTQLDIEVPDLTDEKYNVGWKDYTDELPDYFVEGTAQLPITWFNNFYVKIPGDPGNGIRVRQYKITLQTPPVNSRLFYFDTIEKVVNEVKFDPNQTTVTFHLDLGDPPVGVYP
jgi:hypothetical protein